MPTSPIQENVDQKPGQLFVKSTKSLANVSSPAATPTGTLELPPLTSHSCADVHSHNNDRASLASTTSSLVSSNSSNDLTTATALSSHTSSMQSNSAAIAHLTSLMSSASHGSANKDLVPVAFLPIGLVLPCMMQQPQQQQQLKYSSEENKPGLMKSHLSGLDTATMNGVSPSTSIISNMSSMSSRTMMTTTNMPAVSLNDLPHVELNVASVDFGQIAEGCCTSMLLTLKVTPSSNSNKRKLQILTGFIFA
jgi:hypothetical protein